MRFGGHQRGRRGRIEARLADLERAYERALAATSGPSREAIAAEARDKIREIIAQRGVEQRPNESLMEAFARALGVTGPELREHIARRIARRIDQ